jgi:hypothetical protein
MNIAEDAEGPGVATAATLTGNTLRFDSPIGAWCEVMVDDYMFVTVAREEDGEDDERVAMISMDVGLDLLTVAALAAVPGAGRLARFRRWLIEWIGGVR